MNNIEGVIRVGQGQRITDGQFDLG